MLMKTSLVSQGFCHEPKFYYCQDISLLIDSHPESLLGMCWKTVDYLIILQSIYVINITRGRD